MTADLDDIGRDNFMESKAPRSLSTAQDVHYSQSSSLFSIQVWRSQLVYRLIQIVRAQWIYHCDIVHKRDKDGLKQTEAAVLHVTIRGEHKTGCADLQDEDRFVFSHGCAIVMLWRRPTEIMGACSKGCQAHSS